MVQGKHVGSCSVPAETHMGENIGTTATHVVFVELK